MLTWVLSQTPPSSRNCSADLAQRLTALGYQHQVGHLWCCLVTKGFSTEPFPTTAFSCTLNCIFVANASRCFWLLAHVLTPGLSKFWSRHFSAVLLGVVLTFLVLTFRSAFSLLIEKQIMSHTQVIATKTDQKLRYCKSDSITTFSWAIKMVCLL